MKNKGLEAEGAATLSIAHCDTDTRQDPSKRVRWRESLEEMFYEEPDTECVVVDLGQDRARPPPRRQVRRQFSVEEPGAGGMLEICHFSRGHISTVWTVLCNSSVSDQLYQSCNQN